MSGHTPGPWGWFNLRSNDDFDIKALDTKDWQSANCGLESEHRAVIIPWDYEGYSAGIYVREEDARLIAAAPDLLEALKEAVEWDSHDDDGVPALWLDAANSAIAKAEGREG